MADTQTTTMPEGNPECGDDHEQIDVQQELPSDLAPDGGWGWVVVFGSFMIFFIADGCSLSFGVFYPEFLDYFEESKGKTAIIVAMMYGLPPVLSPLVCALVNIFGCRSIGMVGGVLVGLAFLISFFGTSVEFLIVSIGGLCSLGLQMSYIAALLSVTYYFEARRGLATGLAVAGSGCGVFTFAPVFEALILTYAWRGALLVVASICFNMVAASCLFRPIVTEPCYRIESRGEGGNGGRLIMEVPVSSKENIPMVQLHEPDEAGDPNRGAETMVLSESKIVLVSREGSECDKVSTNISGAGSGHFSKGSSVLESEELGNKAMIDDGFLLPPSGQRPVGQVVSASAELLSVPPSSLHRTLSHSDRGLHHRKDSTGRFTSLQEIRYSGHGASSIIFTSGTSFRNQAAGTVKTPQSPDEPADDNQVNRPRLGISYFLFELKQEVRNIFDVSLMKHPGYQLICVSNFMLCCWYGAPYTYIVDKAELHGIDYLRASFLVSIMGITSTVGQILYGLMADKLKNSVFMYEVSMVLCGIATFLIPACTSYWSHCIVVGAFGCFISANYALTTLILIQVVGLERLSTAFGFLQFGQGIGTVIGTPLAGLIFDHTGSYNLAFYIGGVWISLSGLILLPLHWIVHDESCLHKKPEPQDYDYEEAPQQASG